MEVDKTASLNDNNSNHAQTSHLNWESTDISQPSHYVGIGASAGGLEALQQLFKNIPGDTNLGFIVVQHLSPDFKSVMAELLSKHTSMPVYTVQDGVEVKPNTIYLIPPRKNMLIAEGRLLLSDQMPDQGVSLPIDIFLRALAEDQQHKSIAIILSGTGSDGSRGIKSIKEAGGLVLVQDPSDAKFDGMPYCAVNTGTADFVLAAEKIGEQLVKYIRHPMINGTSPSLRNHIVSNEDIMAEMFSLLKRKSGIDFTHYKPSTVARRIERRMGINQFADIRDYLSLLFNSSKETLTLSKELLIGVTRFFRDEEVFDQLEKDIIPKIISRNNNDDEGIRIWISGCSTGEEAYSIAILFDEAMSLLSNRRKLKIFATDVDADAIVEASAGRYTEEISQDITPERLFRYFNKVGQSYEVKPELRQSVIFATHNMISDPPFSNIDLVSCRNVLIYFQQIIQKKVLAAFHFALKKTGILLLGPSESLGDLKNNFDTITERTKVFEKISNTRIPLDAPPLMKDSSKNFIHNMPHVGSLMRNYRDSPKTTPPDFVKEKLLKLYLPNCIVLNEEQEAVHIYGEVAKFIKPAYAGKVSTHIKDIIIPELATAVNTALSRAEKSGEMVRYSDIVIKNSDQEMTLDLTAFFLREKENSNTKNYYVLLFQAINPNIGPDIPQLKGESFDVHEQSLQRILDLEQELLKKQEHLQITIEELETTNEELQSANEELMSANEELQSTNEELQSVNEELYTVNSEYQDKIDELILVNTDVDNILSSNKIGSIFLDEKHLIRKYTQVATQFVNLVPSDIGRPFHHISHELIYPEFFQDITNVINNQVEVRKEVLGHQKNWVLIKLAPYYKSNHSIHSNKKNEGVIITFIDLIEENSLKDRSNIQ